MTVGLQACENPAPIKSVPDRNSAEESLLCFGHRSFPPLMWHTPCMCVCVCPDNYQLIVLCSISLGASLIFLNLFCIPNFYPVNLSVDVLRPYLTVLF